MKNNMHQPEYITLSTMADATDNWAWFYKNRTNRDYSKYRNFQIFVKAFAILPNGEWVSKSITAEVSVDTTINQLKQFLEKREEIPVYAQKIYKTQRDSASLSDQEILFQLGIRKESFLYLYVK